MKSKILLLVLIIVLCVSIIACDDLQEEAVITDHKIDTNEEEKPIGLEEKIEEATNVETVDEEVHKQENNETEEKKDPLRNETIDYEKFRPNEAGRVMVIMYHSLGEKESNYVSTPEVLRENLKDLYDRSYVLVSLKDFVNNTMDLPAGKTPVVLAFDDGHNSNFNVIEEDGELKVDPNSAVGIIDSFYEKYPDFNRAASFFLNANISFSQVEYKDFKLNYLIDNGYDVGSHSYGHDHLTELDAKGIQKTLGKNVQLIEEVVDGYTVNTLALPFGKRPKEESLEKYVYQGVYDNEPYEFIAVLNVGWNPTYSPVHENFDFRSINRVQSGSGEFQLSYWIDYFDKNPDKKYISDGHMGKITVPKALEDKINHSAIKDQELIIYERD